MNMLERMLGKRIGSTEFKFIRGFRLKRPIPVTVYWNDNDCCYYVYSPDLNVFGLDVSMVSRAKADFANNVIERLNMLRLDPTGEVGNNQQFKKIVPKFFVGRWE